ncbi:MAG: c-type cytochrome [Thiohalomonadales bacterium]|nr:c-type cytochrome [Thiohalomonadales bacterium]
MKKMLLITASVALIGAVSTAHAEGAGENTYKMACFACHGTGAAGAPKFGDKAAWKPHIDKGMDTLYTHAINGFQGSSGVMPPKGGRTDLSDADVKAAVDYMVSNSK